MKTIVDECAHCGVKLWYNTEQDSYAWENDGGLDCQHEGQTTYRGADPKECGMCQGAGQLPVRGRSVQCDACHGTGEIP